MNEMNEMSSGSKGFEKFEVQVEQTQETPRAKLVDKKRSTPEITPLTTPNARTRTSTSVKQRRAAKFQTTKAARHQKKAIEINSKTPASDLKTTGSINKRFVMRKKPVSFDYKTGNKTSISNTPLVCEIQRLFHYYIANNFSEWYNFVCCSTNNTNRKKYGKVSNTTPQKKSTKILPLINETKRNTTTTAVPISLTKDAKSILNAVRLVQPVWNMTGVSRESTMKNQN
uniref:Uncharacterized protein n=1 Tax=Heterorhabditis bacteriophora TaxID=37862 RepID=A0A1I7XAJ7_HETBA